MEYVLVEKMKKNDFYFPVLTFSSEGQVFLNSETKQL